MPGTAPLSIGVVAVLVTVNAPAAEDVPADVPVDGAEDGAEPAPADGETRPGPGDVAALAGLPPLPARTGSAAPSPLKTATAATLNAATPAATPSGSPHLRASEACLSSGSVFINSSSRIRR
jgi:hypothetical protein